MRFSKKLLNNIGVTALSMIEENIDSGVDIYGKRYAYSRRPFYRPYDPDIVKKMGGRKGKGRFYQIFTNKSGKLGMIILGGYKAYKEQVNPTAKGDYLTWSGQMLRNMKIVKTDANDVRVGFSDPQAAQKAFWFNVSGVGRSRKRWRFLGLRKEQIRRMEQKYGVKITNELGDMLLKNTNAKF